MKKAIQKDISRFLMEGCTGKWEQEYHCVGNWGPGALDKRMES